MLPDLEAISRPISETVRAEYAFGRPVGGGITIFFPLVGTVVVSAQAGLSPGSVQCRVVLIYPDGSTNTTQLSI